MDESTKQTGNGNTKESTDDSQASEIDEEEIVPTTPIRRKKQKRSSPIAKSSDEEQVSKKGRYHTSSTRFEGRGDGFDDSDDDRGQHIGSVFTSADRDLLVRIEKQLEQIECFLKKSSNCKKVCK
jgi:hypothetical protein